MIKKIILFSIDIYQIIFSTLLKNLLGVNKFCRFDESCSEFTKRNIAEKGLMKGTRTGLMRLLKCQPFYPAPLLGKAVDNLKSESQDEIPPRSRVNRAIVDKRCGVYSPFKAAGRQA